MIRTIAYKTRSTLSLQQAPIQPNRDTTIMKEPKMIPAYPRMSPADCRSKFKSSALSTKASLTSSQPTLKTIPTMRAARPKTRNIMLIVTTIIREFYSHHFEYLSRH
uniref:Uncharacterized protein n=1 Tax=Arion vulgaris TaxID=1028688 RepID=A0A0B6ZJG8_9EUPU